MQVFQLYTIEMILAGDTGVNLMMPHYAPEWVRTSDPVTSGAAPHISTTSPVESILSSQTTQCFMIIG